MPCRPVHRLWQPIITGKTGIILKHTRIIVYIWFNNEAGVLAGTDHV